MPASRPTVLRIVPTLDFGGIETALVIHAAHFNASEYALRVCTFWKKGRAAADIEHLGVPVDVLEVNPSIRNACATVALARYTRQLKPDILHASVPEAVFHASVLGSMSGARLTLTDEAGMPRRTGARRLLLAALHRNVNGHIAVSEALRDYLVTREHVSPERVRVIHTSGKAEFFEAPKDDYEVVARPFRIATVGRLVDIKNQAILIEAVARLANAGLTVELAISGDGPRKAALQQLACQFGVENHVHLVGFVANVVDFLKTADVYALPSHSEGCSLSLIEAMATGLPILASDIPGNQEVLRGYDPRWLVPTTDVRAWAGAIREMAALAPSSRAQLGRLARSLAEESFSPRRHVATLEQLYREALDEEKRSRLFARPGLQWSIR